MNDPVNPEEAIFEAALALPASERAAYLDRTCGGKAGLRELVEALLEAHEEADEFLEQPAPGVELSPAAGPRSQPAGSETTASSIEKPGDRIGRYKLLQQIGEGGCGVVYMAEQEEPVRRKVALKVIKLGMETKQVIARFEAERQALALMDHPNIAKVLDAGSTETGRPYFVMELVRGIKITDYCDQTNLPTRERLALFVQVCQAIQHAHQKGIIHRDIKPSNILVTVSDPGAPGCPKVIDFGIAKATEGRLTDKTLFTAFEQFMGTPAYMSPEQAMMTSLDIDTRSDIYSLGVLLYELMTGTTPFDQKELLASGLDAMRRTILEKDPARPSTRLNTMLENELTMVAGRRNVEATKLKSLIRGDLDWIVMRAMEKDRTRRYETANGLAMDIQRHMNCEPVVASPPSRLYEFEKTVRRHKFGFAAAAAVAAAMVFGLGLSTWSFHKQKAARRQAVEARAQAQANFQIARDAVDRMLTRVATDLAGEPRMVQLRRTLLEDALKFYQQFVQRKGDDPALRYDLARAYIRVGDIYKWLGEFEKLPAPVEQALVIFGELARQYPTDPRYRVDMVEGYYLLGGAKTWLGRNAEAIAHSRSKVGVCEDLRRQFPTVPEYLYSAASAHEALGNDLRAVAPSESLDELRQALKLYENHRDRFPNVPQDRARLAHILEWLGACLQDNGRYEESEREYRRSIELRTRLVREEPQDLGMQDGLAHVKAYFADLLAKTGRGVEAVELFQEAAAFHEKRLNDQLRYADSARRAGIEYRELGELLSAIHRTEEAKTALRRAIEIHGGLAGNLVGVPEYRANLAEDHYALAVLLEATGRSPEAAQAFRKAIELFEQVIAENPHSPVFPHSLGWRLATCPAVQFRYPPRALALAQQTVQRAPERGESWKLLGIAQYRAGQPTEAIESLRKALELPDGGEPGQWFFLALAYWQNQNHRQALEWYEKAIAWMEKNHPADESLVRFRAEAEEALRREK
jgi:serine/threonine protein kinase